METIKLLNLFEELKIITITSYLKSPESVVCLHQIVFPQLAFFIHYIVTQYEVQSLSYFS